MIQAKAYYDENPRSKNEQGERGKRYSTVHFFS